MSDRVAAIDAEIRTLEQDQLLAQEIFMSSEDIALRHECILALLDERAALEASR